MELFKWMGKGSLYQSSSRAPNGVKTGGVKPTSHADYKQFGLENFGNTCYANAVLQALYFCQPFRDLVCDSHDKSNPPIPPSSFLVPSPPASLITPLPSRAPPIKAFRRRDSAIDTSKPADDSIPNGFSSSSGRASSSSTSANPPIPATPPTLFSALRSLFLHIALNPSDKGTVSPLSFITKLKKENELYRSSMHQDAHEFFNFLLNKIVEDLQAELKKNVELSDELSSSIASLPAATSSSASTASPSQSNSTANDSHRHPNTTFVHSLFEGTLASETRCLTCETVSSRDESFLDLSIDIEQNSSVTSCLRQFSASEMLSHKNKFFCDSCGGLQEAEKRMKIKKLPNVLALHLKRFKYQEDVQKYIKLAYRVAFPFELRLFNTVDDADDPDRLYQLFAIVVHIGGGPHHGHYIAIIKAHDTWLVFDDDNVDTIREGDIPRYFGESPGGAGYVLFYQAVDLDLAAAAEPAPSEAGEVSVGEEAESSGDSEPAVPATPSSVAQAIAPTPADLKLEIPTVLETSASTVTQSASTPSASMPSASTSSNGFFPNLGIARTLKHAQSIKMTTDKKRAAAAQHEADQSSPRPPTNGDAPSPLRHSRSLKGKVGDAGAWFGGRKKDKDRKEKRPAVPPVPVPMRGDVGTGVGSMSAREGEAERLLAVDDLAAGGERKHDERRPSAPGQLERAPEPPPENEFPPFSSQAVPLATSPPSPLPPPTPPPRSSARPATSPSALPSSSAFPSSSTPPVPPSPLPSSFVPTSSAPVPPTLITSSPEFSSLGTPTAQLPSLPSPSVAQASFPSSPTAPLPSSPRTRKLSQQQPTPQPTARSELPPAERMRPSTAGAKPRRASRKMSLSAMPLGNMFGRKDKDKGSRTVASKEPANDTSRIGQAI